MRAYLSMSRSKRSLCVSLQTCGAGLGLPSSALVRAETSQDRRAIKASSLSVRPAGEKQRKRPILLLCKPLFHFHTSHSLSLLWYYTGFLAHIQLWTQYSLWDHGSHLLPWVSLKATAYSYHLILKNWPKVGPMFLLHSNSVVSPDVVQTQSPQHCALPVISLTSAKRVRLSRTLASR